MKYLAVILLQLFSFAAMAGGTSSSLLVTVTVVRPAPVTTVIDVNGQIVTRAGNLIEQPATTTTTEGGIQYVTVDY